MSEGGDPIPVGDFDECFAEFDKNGSGSIEKAEMVKFIKTHVGMV